MLFEELVWLDDPVPHSAALNMAIDEVLLRTATQPVLRTYRWARAAVSFGYFGAHDEVSRRFPGRERVRRWTGGGVVLHGEDFTYSVMVPRGHAFAGCGAEETYRAIHEVIGTVLGPEVALAIEVAAPRSDACFENPVRHDLVAEGVKIAGAAQRRTRAGLLHQGSVQCAGLPGNTGERLAAALSARVERQEPPPALLAEAADLAATRYAAAAWLRRA